MYICCFPLKNGKAELNWTDWEHTQTVLHVSTGKSVKHSGVNQPTPEIVGDVKEALVIG